MNLAISVHFRVMKQVLVIVPSICRSLSLFLLFFFFSNAFMLCFGLFLKTVSLCSPGCSETLSVEQVGLELREPASASGLHHYHPAFTLVFNFKILDFVRSWDHSRMFTVSPVKSGDQWSDLSGQ